MSHDKFKRKALLAPNYGNENNKMTAGGITNDDQQSKHKNPPANFHMPVGGNLNTLGGLPASGRTPLTNRTAFMPQGTWNQQAQVGVARSIPRPTFPATTDRAYSSGYSTANNSESANEVEDLLLGLGGKRTSVNHPSWNPRQMSRSDIQAFSNGKRASKFRPSGPTA